MPRPWAPAFAGETGVVGSGFWWVRRVFCRFPVFAWPRSHWIPDHVRNDERRLAAQAGYLRSSVIGVVPRGRIELPTHGFSVHCSTD